MERYRTFAALGYTQIMKERSMILEHAKELGIAPYDYGLAGADEAVLGLERLFKDNHLRPTSELVEARRDEIAAFLARRNVALVVPMKERGAAVSSLLETVTGQFPADLVVVVDDGSAESAVRAALRSGARVVAKDAVLDAIDWERLLPILSLAERPSGKGSAVLAGHLTAYYAALGGGAAPAWLCQHDADLLDYGRNRGIDLLAWAALAAGEKTEHIKMAQPGRGNESCMAARSGLLALERLLKADLFGARDVAERAGDLFRRLSRYKWMLCGQFMLRWEAALSRPFASGYLEETLICAFMEDRASELGTRTVQVENPGRCNDAVNGCRKEAAILQAVNNFLLQLAFIRKPVHHWTLADIARINKHYMRHSGELMGLIAPGDGPVVVQRVSEERILPSVRMLAENGFIREDAARAWRSS